MPSNLAITIISLVAMAICVSPALAQNPAANYPNKPLRLIIPYVAGGLGDTVGRLVAQHLTTSLAQTVVADNRPGASQAIALELTAKAPPDGYTLVLGTQSGLIFATAARKSLPYDPMRDITSISMLFTVPYYLIVHPSVAAKNVSELVALAKANPGKYSFGSIGVGSGNHLAMEILKARTGVDMVHVPFKGAPQAMLALVAGDLNLTFEGPVTSLPNIRSGKIRALASSGLERTQALPDLPTMAESGVPGFDVVTWFGLSTTGGTPRPIIERLNREVGEFLKLPATRARFNDLNLDIVYSTPEAMTARLQADLPLITKVMRAAGIQPE
ncbi:MAG: Bug family tripartite tricarboxylate transporter substrate binding protein [Burkholderiales bacterium]